jgi:HSF-type DNA-binding
MLQTVRAHPARSNRSYFPTQLYALLQQAEDDGMASIVSWQPHGHAFKVHCKEQFEQIVLPR